MYYEAIFTQAPIFEVLVMSLWSKSRFISKILILWNCRFFRDRSVEELSISWDAIWIAGRPWSRQDPPGPENRLENLVKLENSKIWGRRASRRPFKYRFAQRKGGHLVLYDPPCQQGWHPPSRLAPLALLLYGSVRLIGSRAPTFRSPARASSHEKIWGPSSSQQSIVHHGCLGVNRCMNWLTCTKCYGNAMLYPIHFMSKNGLGPIGLRALEALTLSVTWPRLDSIFECGI